MTLYVGIDPGVVTGLAVSDRGKLVRVESMRAVEAESAVLGLQRELRPLVLVVEDARKRTWFTGGREKAQGAGSIKRDCSRWEEFCEHHGLRLTLVHPASNRTKTTAPRFAAITGWSARTNEHARDAAMLVFGRG